MKLEIVALTLGNGTKRLRRRKKNMTIRTGMFNVYIEFQTQFWMRFQIVHSIVWKSAKKK